jgi:hypothetical protein
MKNAMVGSMIGSTVGRRWRATLAFAVAVPAAVWTSIEAPAYADPAQPAVPVASAPVAQAEPPPPAPPGAPPAADMIPPPVIAPPAPPPPAPAPADDLKKIETGFALRVGGRLQGTTDRSKLNDFGFDEVYAEARFSGRLTPLFAWQFNLNASYDPLGGAGTAGIMDAIVKFEPMKEFHLWAGRMLVPSDRSNFSGPWFMSPWKYTGADMPIPFVGPRTQAFGRQNGVTAWGTFGDGKVKYYAGALNLSNAAESPLFSGRLNICLIGAEPGYYHSSTYYGSQDIVAIAGGAQYQANAAPMGASGANYTEFNADVLAEKNLGAGGVGTIEAGYYHYNNFFGTFVPPGATTGAPAVKNFFYVLGSWLTPQPIGIGKLQPLVRWQQTTDPSWKILDAYVTYVIDEYFLRFAVGYERTDFGGGTSAGNAILLGAQMQR